MTTMTLRGIDDEVSAALKEKARREDASVNAVTLKILREALGVDRKRRNVIYADLDHLAGTWSAKDSAEFDKTTAVFEKVDEDMWK